MNARRYEPILKIASGGTAAVHVGAASGSLGFRQLVAIKVPHAHLADDPAFVAALVEEAKIASRLHHANVVDVRDVEADDAGVQLVMDYVEGASLSELIRAWTRDEHAVAIRIVLDACEGLRAVHELANDDGKPLGLVHRDVSPANVLVGLDGVARIADFGLAKPLLAVDRTTSEGSLRGKLGYMAPEYVRGKAIDRRVDVFATGVVLWEALARKRLFRGENDAETLDRIQRSDPPRLAELAPALPTSCAAALDNVIARALAKDPDVRFATVDALAAALQTIAKSHDLLASHADVRASFPPSLHATLDERRKKVTEALAKSPDSKSWGIDTQPQSRAPNVSPMAGSVIESLEGSIATKIDRAMASPEIGPSEIVPSPMAGSFVGRVPSAHDLGNAVNETLASPLGNGGNGAAPSYPPMRPRMPSTEPAAYADTMLAIPPEMSLAPKSPSSAPPSSAPASTPSVSVTRASATSSAPSSSPPSAAPASVAPASAMAAAPRSLRSLAPIGAAVVGVGALALALAFALGSEDTTPARATEARAASSDRHPRADGVRTRAPVAEPSASTSAAGPASLVRAHPASSEPGSKTPRPNPYPDHH